MRSPLHHWLDLPENSGQAVRLAEHVGVSKAAVSLWRQSGVPLRHVQRVADYTAGAVTVESMLAHLLSLKAGTPAEVRDAA